MEAWERKKMYLPELKAKRTSTINKKFNYLLNFTKLNRVAPDSAVNYKI